MKKISKKEFLKLCNAEDRIKSHLAFCLSNSNPAILAELENIQNKIEQYLNSNK